MNPQHFKSGQIRYETWTYGITYHRLDGPAWIRYWENGQLAEEGWYTHGKHHRLDGPSKVCYTPDGAPIEELWHLDGRLHRMDGPARQVWCPATGTLTCMAYHLYGVQVTSFKHKELIVMSELDRLVELARHCAQRMLPIPLKLIIRLISKINPRLARTLKAALTLA